MKNVHMPNGYPPSVFVSSTCYDLKQVRLDLKKFIEGQGFVAVISESSAFPVNPQADNLENCIRAVKDRADLFVLIVGGRYGSQTSKGQSITNLEYLEARSKGVPIYVFVAKQILHTLPLWESNPVADFSSVVDTVKLFDFVSFLRGEAGHWVFAFDDADEIATTLRQQWALLFTEALTDRERLRSQKLPPELQDLSVRCLRILLERPFGWEFRFFAAVLREEIDKRAALRRDFEYGLKMGLVTHPKSVLQVAEILGERLSEMMILSGCAVTIFETALQEGIGPEGQSGSPQLLAYAARRLGEVYGRSLDWANNLLSISADSEFDRVFAIIKSFPETIFEKLEGLPSLIESETDKAETADRCGEKAKINIMLVFDSPRTEDLKTEFDRLHGLVATRHLI